MSFAESCSLRHARLEEAQRACLALADWCGGVVHDAGLHCGGGRAPLLPFELRRAPPRRHAASARAAYLLLDRSNSSAHCDHLKALHAAHAAAAAAAAHAAAAAAAAAASLSLSRNRTARCAAGVDWRSPRGPAELAALLANRSACPAEWLTLWPRGSRGDTPPRRGGCCGSAAAEAVYEPCAGGTPPPRRAALAAAAARRLRRVLVLGDSLSSQWAAALALDLHGRVGGGGALHVEPTEAAWCGARGGTDWRARVAPRLDVASFSVRRIANASADGGGCPAEGEGRWQRLGTRYRSTVVRVLARYAPDVVVANLGLHYDGVRPSDGGAAYEGGVRVLLQVLSEYAAAARPRPLLLFRETAAQHFWSARGDGSYHEQERHAEWANERDVAAHACAPINWSDAAVGALPAADGPAPLNRLAARVVREFDGVGWLPMFRAFAPRHEMHVHPAEGRDCTHYCYAPLLWDAALLPFYEAVVGWRAEARRGAHGDAAATLRTRGRLATDRIGQ
ncbi:hypothetical protein AB1Y20_014290 [Prymnesium parvum]|uniref:SGNH hydrolase-type esterase domain-containing protein n=1 Tax=Prymnesium parvum TaxID=97485 RepID=A0AB34IDA0_PRYPA